MCAHVRPKNMGMQVRLFLMNEWKGARDEGQN